MKEGVKRRNTIQRKLVLKAVSSLHNHPTADEVYDSIVITYPDISRATVYRNLNILCEAGELRRIRVPYAADRFDDTLERHYHIKCSSCGSFTDVDIDYIANIDDAVAKLTGYILQEHNIVFTGVCPACQAAKAVNI